MELGGEACSFQKTMASVGFPGLDYQTGCVPTTPVKPVPARQQRAEGDKELHWLSSLGIPSAAELPVEIADSNGVRGFPGLDFQTSCFPTTPVKPVPSRQQMTEGGKELNTISTFQQFMMPIGKGRPIKITPRLGQNFHGGNIVCGFTGFCSAVTQVSSPVMQPSLPTALYPGHKTMAVGTTKGISIPSCLVPSALLSVAAELLLQISGAMLAYHILTNTDSPFPCNTEIKAPNSSKTQVVDAPLAPVTPEKTTRKENVLDSSASTPIGLSALTEPCTKEKVHKDNQQNSATPPRVPCADSKGEPSAEQQNKKRQVDDSQQSITEIPVKERISTDKAHVDGVDLNRTPPQKPKRKKVRPKAVREGKPRKTQVQQFPTGDLDETMTNLNNLPLRKSPELDHSSMGVEKSKHKEILPHTISRVEIPGSNSNKHV